MRMCVIQGCADLFSTFMSFPTSCLRRRKGPAVPERDLQKMDRVKIALRHGLSQTPHVIKFSAPFPVVKQKHVSGNTLVSSYPKIWNKDDKNFTPKMTFFQMLKFFFESGMCSKSLVTN